MTVPVFLAPPSVEAAARRWRSGSAPGAVEAALRAPGAAGPRRGSTSSGAGALVTAAVAVLTAAAGPLRPVEVLPRDSLWVEAPFQRNQQHQQIPRLRRPREELRREVHVRLLLRLLLPRGLLGRGLLLHACVDIKLYGAFVLNRRVVLHAIDATLARWRRFREEGADAWLISTQFIDLVLDVELELVDRYVRRDGLDAR